MAKVNGVSHQTKLMFLAWPAAANFSFESVSPGMQLNFGAWPAVANVKVRVKFKGVSPRTLRELAGDLLFAGAQKVSKTAFFEPQGWGRLKRIGG